MLNRVKNLSSIVLLTGSLWVCGYGQRVINDSLTLPVSLPTGAYQLELAWNSFNQPIALANPPGEDNQLFIAERGGRIRVITSLATNTIQATSVLNISNSRSVTTDGENGLLGLAFHPDYRQNKRIFVFYTHNQQNTRRTRVSSFLISDDSPVTADPDSEIIYFDQVDQATNHNGGDLHFGPDGYLYVALGDEGNANDSLNNSQRVDKDFFSGIVRLDVDKRPGNVEPTSHPAIPRDNEGKAFYSIPNGNPLVALWQQAGSDPESDLRLEFYAIGLRNPWRMAFDNPTGRLWVGDVGQGAREEVDLIEKGGNYGWAFREGFIAGPKNQTPPPGFETISDPIYDYPRGDGQSITGGVVYRGTRLPELEGAYIFGDYGSGRVWALFENPGGGLPTRVQLTTYSNHYEYGIDPSNGDVLIAGGDGNIRRLVRGDGGTEPEFPATLSQTGAFKSLVTLEPENGILAYELNVSFWSDHAAKSRWVSVPDARIAYSLDNNWDFPEGTIWVKHFELALERGNPESQVRVETRFLVKTQRGVYGLSYRWNEAGTEAALVTENGVNIDYPILVNGQPYTQTWRIPSRQECLQCHTGAAGYALSFNARQLNRQQLIDGAQRNLLQYLGDSEILDTQLDDLEEFPVFHRADDAGSSQLVRVRSYLAVNCVSCHQPGAVASTTWDARPHIGLLNTGLINGLPLNNGGNSEHRLIVPSDTERSVLLSRISASHGFIRMPNIATNELDEAGIKLVSDWISSISTGFLGWQDQTFDDPEALIADQDSDPDFDGASNRFEYLTGTHPFDPMSTWKPTVSIQNGDLTVSFPTIPDRNYSVLSGEDIDNPTSWSVDGNPLEATSEGEATLSNSGVITPSFIRVKVSE